MSEQAEMPVDTAERFRKGLEEIQDLAASDNKGDNVDEIHAITIDLLGEEDSSGD